jgi:threonine/homoserine/homoserine lactone efflux protein
MLVFAAAVFLLIITPGPGVMSTAGVGAAFGAAAGYRYVIGLCIGTNLVALAVVTGVAGAVLAQPGLRQILTGLSLIYIVWLALRVATVGAQIDFVSNDRAPGIRAALLLQALNPKAYVVNTTLFAGFAFDGQSWLMEILIKFLIINLIWIPIHLGWLAAGIALQRLDLPKRQQRAINIGMAIALLAVVALAIVRS